MPAFSAARKKAVGQLLPAESKTAPSPYTQLDLSADALTELV
jgi:hypothetical protein